MTSCHLHPFLKQQPKMVVACGKEKQGLGTITTDKSVLAQFPIYRLPFPPFPMLSCTSRRHLHFIFEIVNIRDFKIWDATAVRCSQKWIFKEETYYACSSRCPNGIKFRQERGFARFDILSKTWVFLFQCLNEMILYSSRNVELSILGSFGRNLWWNLI